MHPSKSGTAAPNFNRASLPEDIKKEDKHGANSGTGDSGFFSGQNLSEDFPCSFEETQAKIDQVELAPLSSAFAPLPPSTGQSYKEEDSGVALDFSQNRSDNMNELCKELSSLKMGQKEAVSELPGFEQLLCQNDDGDTYLHWLVAQHNLNAVDHWLHISLRFGLDIQNDFGQTPLHIAVLTNQPDIVQRLVKHGANVGIRDIEGNTPLHLACIYGATGCAKALLSSRLSSPTPQDLEQWNYNGRRCVHLAVESSNIDILKFLIKAGADINSREGKAGFTPLHIAVEANNYDVVQFLLQCPVRIEQETYAGLTAYQLAGMLCNTRLLVELKSFGAEPLSPPQSDSEEDDESDSDDKIPPFYGSNAFGSNFAGLSAINVA